MPLSNIQILGTSTNKKMKEFNEYSIFVATMFNSYLPNNLKFGRIRKIVLELLDTDLYGSSILEIIGSEKTSVCTIKKSLNFSVFFEMSSLEKKKLLTTQLYEALLKLSNEFEWSEHPFKQAFEKVVQVNFESQILFSKLKSNKSRNKQAGLYIDQDIGLATALVVFFNSEQEIVRKIEIFKISPHPIVYSQILANSRWINDTDFEIINNSGELHIVVSTLKDTPTIFFTPKNREVAGIMEELKFLLQGNLPSWLKETSWRKSSGCGR